MSSEQDVQVGGTYISKKICLFNKFHADRVQNVIQYSKWSQQRSKTTDSQTYKMQSEVSKGR